MEILEWLRLIAGGALLLSGLIIFLIELYGVFHLKYVLNRMHAADDPASVDLGGRRISKKGRTF